jgi:hypothetical protein
MEERPTTNREIKVQILSTPTYLFFAQTAYAVGNCPTPNRDRRPGDLSQGASASGRRSDGHQYPRSVQIPGRQDPQNGQKIPTASGANPASPGRSSVEGKYSDRPSSTQSPPFERGFRRCHELAKWGITHTPQNLQLLHLQTTLSPNPFLLSPTLPNLRRF